MGRSNNTRIINKFEFWSVADCACEFCINYTKDQPCPLDVCCIEDIRQEAIRREAEATANNGGVFVSADVQEAEVLSQSNSDLPHPTHPTAKEVVLNAVD